MIEDQKNNINSLDLELMKSNNKLEMLSKEINSNNNISFSEELNNSVNLRNSIRNKKNLYNNYINNKRKYSTLNNFNFNGSSIHYMFKPNFIILINLQPSISINNIYYMY